MFSYYESKSKIVDYYPPPKHKRIIEPFAGSARYSLKYWQNDVLLVDKYPVIVDVWNYLKNASEQDIKGLPKLNTGQTIDDYFESDGANYDAAILSAPYPVFKWCLENHFDVFSLLDSGEAVQHEV